jgi:hypothetical protein
VGAHLDLPLSVEDLIADRMGQFASGSANFPQDWIVIIWIEGYVKRQRRIMAFKTLKTKCEAISLAALGEEIMVRRIVVGEVSVPGNAGTRRTASKKAVLKQIAKVGGDW